jgi:HK97 family phage prohead protease
MRELEKKSFRLEIKSTSIENNVGKFDGYAAIFGKLDFNNDIIETGAFKRSLDLQGNKRPLYFEHVPHRLLGASYVAEDEIGLKVQGEINLDTQVGREQFSNMQKGYLDTMSIGYMTISADWIGSTRYLKEIALWETTLTTLPAMPDARVEAKSVVPYQDLPIAPDDTAWDASAATSRVVEWAGGPDKEKIDWGKYKRAFLWFDEENPTKFGSYKLGIGDIIGGSLKAVPKAIFAVAGVLNGARGGVDIPSDDKDKIWNQLQRYYKKMDKEMPEKASLEGLEEKIVDETENFIRIRVEDPDKFVDDSFRTITISKDKGITALIGKYKSDPNGPTHIQNYMFAKEKGWTVAEAKKWVAEHKNILETLLLETSAKSLLKIEPVLKGTDTLSALIEDIKKFT